MPVVNLKEFRWRTPDGQENQGLFETLNTTPWEIIKTNPKRTVYQIGPYVLKAYHYRSPIEWLKRLLADGALKEWTMSSRLFKAGVPVPRPVAFGTRAHQSVIVTRYVEASVTATEFIRQQWADLSRLQRRRATETFADFILGLFRVGLVQSDFNLGNLLVTDHGGGYYAIDLQRARHLGRPLTVPEMADNLAYLLPCFMSLSNRDRLFFFAVCLKSVPELRPWLKKIEEQAFAMMRQQWLKKSPRKLRETSRNNHRFEFDRNSGYLGTGLNGALKEIFTADPDRLSDFAVKTLKNDRRSQVCLIEHEGRRLILKRYKIKNLWHRIRQLLQPRADRIWNANHLFSARMLPTPELLAVADLGQGFDYQGTLAIFEYLETAADSKRDLQENYLHTPLRTRALQKLAGFLWDMHRRGVYHGDAKISNFIWMGESETIRVIDLDGVRFFQRVGDKQRLDDLKNLAASLVWWDQDKLLTEELFSAYVKRHRPWQAQPEHWLKRLKKQVEHQLAHREKRQKPQSGV